MIRALRNAAVAALFAICGTLSGNEIERLATIEIEGDSKDASGLTELLEGDVPHDRFGGISAIEHLGDGRYLVLPDRGPADGATQYRCRFQTAELALHAGTKPKFDFALTSTTMLQDERGRSLLGTAAIDPARPQETARRLDPEGLRQSRDGMIWVSDEYGPAIAGFDSAGRRRRTIPVPEMFLADPSFTGDEDSATRGRQDNRGMEGLAISADGRRLIGLMQGPLLQDGALDAEGERTGRHCRLLEVDLATGATRQFVYVLEDPKLGLNEILSMGGDEYLVIERDGKEGKKAVVKRLYKIDLSEATDVSAVEALPATDLPPDVRPVKKSLFLDLLDPRFGLAGPSIPSKVEGLTFGPDLPDGRRTLLVATDNDFLADQPSLIYVFAVPKGLLPGVKGSD
jgi:hypothetical protein